MKNHINIAYLVYVCMVSCILSVKFVSAAFNFNSQYVTYQVGNSVLIFSVPHGGSEQPESIPNKRTVCGTSDKPYRGCHLGNGVCDYRHNATYTPQFCQCNKSPEDETCKVSYLKDSYTREIAVGVKDEILSQTERKPYMIINELKRDVMDGNRDKPEATFHDSTAEEAWETYHERIEAAIGDMNSSTLLIDFHGQSHANGWTELGYTLSRNDLNDDPFTHTPEDTTICNLVYIHCAVNDDSCFDDVLRGSKSFGYFLQRQLNENNDEYETVPSPANQGPGTNSYYSGGYNVKRYGSKNCPAAYQIDAIQVEMPRDERWEAVPRAHYITALANAIIDFMDENYPHWNI